VSGATLSRVAVFLDSTSVSVMKVHEAAQDVCQLVWVIGWSPSFPPIRMLSKLGEVADVSSLSAEQSVERIAELHVEGVVVFNDDPIRLAAAVANRLGLIFHTPETAILLTDKLAQRQALQEAGVPVPRFVQVGLRGIEGEMTFPAVLKPRSGAGSRDTYRVNSESEVTQILKTCSPNEEFILEEYIPDRPAASPIAADVVSVESVVRGGAIEHVALTGRFPFAEPFRETGSFLPSDVAISERSAVYAVASASIEALGVCDGIIHTEVKLTPLGPRIVEVNGRLGGGIDAMMTRAGGPPLCEWALRLALGEEVGSIPAGEITSVAFFKFIVGPVGATSLESIEGLDALRHLEGVEEIRVNRRPGEPVDSRESSFHSYAVRIDGLADSHKRLDVLINELIPSTLHVTWR
jgi:biotin carboxylase